MVVMNTHTLLIGLRNTALRNLYFSLFTVLCSLLSCATAQAQTFTDRLRQYEDGRGRVTITQSAEIEDLVNNAVLVPQQAKPTTQQPQVQSQQHPVQQQHQQNQSVPSIPRTPSTTTAPTTPSQPNTTKPSSATTTPSTQTPSGSATTSNNKPQQQPTEAEETTIDTSKKVIRGGKKVQGYRVQVFSGGNSRADRQKAERIGSTMKSHFPDQPIYVHFYSPSWKCRIGNYRTVEEARLILSQVKQLGYSSACIVKGTITVGN
jgi:hypothetical protein